MKRILQLLLLTVCMWFSFKQAHAQEEMFKALFMYNFTKDIEWPAEWKKGSFVITVLGSSDIVGELQKIADKKKVGLQPIEVRKINNIAELEDSHIVFITAGKSSELEEVLARISGKPVLVITDKPGMANLGAGINYIKVDGKQKFEINPKRITTTGLKVNTFLLSLGIVINS